MKWKRPANDTPEDRSARRLRFRRLDAALKAEDVPERVRREYWRFLRRNGTSGGVRLDSVE